MSATDTQQKLKKTVERRRKVDKFQINEVFIDDIEVLENTITPGLGFYCGNRCWGLFCTIG